MEGDHITPWHLGGKKLLKIVRCYVKTAIEENLEYRSSNLKIKFNDKMLLIKTGSFFMMIGSVLSFVALFDSELISKNKLITLLIWITVTLIYFCYSLIIYEVYKKYYIAYTRINF